jgi:uncharacterized tellurite resistance protein B-like protein
LDARPQPAFRALHNAPLPGFLVGLPDIAAVTGPRNKLQLLMNECADTLDSYSRYVGRYPESRGKLEANLMLPVDLWPDATRKEIESLATDVSEKALVITFGDIFGRLKSTGTLTRDKAASFCAALSQAGIAAEPDVRLGARTPKADDALVLFSAPPTVEVPPVDDAYLVATLMIDLAASVAKADGIASDAEISLIDRQIDGWSHLSSRHRTRLKARNLVQLAQPASSAGLKKKLEPLPAEVKQAIAAFLVQTANADGVASREEVKLLEKTYRMLDIDPRRLYTDLHQNASVQPVSTFTPTSTVVADSVSSAGGGLVLDPVRIAALQKETARVSAMLADVFAEEQPAVLPARLAEKPGEEEQTPQALLGLDGAHSTFLRLLVSRPVWTRAELYDAASDLELMLDGAMEQVNEASLDHWDEPLTDGDDPVEVNQELAQRLAA